MASSSSVFFVLDMAELRANGFGVPIFFPIVANGFPHVSSLHLSIRFSLQDGSIWAEREVYDPLTSLLSSTMRKNPILAGNGLSVWGLAAVKYRVYRITHIHQDLYPPLFVRLHFQHLSRRSC